jgi:hypothetical protein
VSTGGLKLTSRDGGAALSDQGPLPAATDADDLPRVWVNTQRRFQVLEGFGGAFTEAAAHAWQQLGAAQRAALLHDCFDPAGGHGYTLCRVHMNSCDFSLGNYAHVDTPGDTALTSFSIARDGQAWMITEQESNDTNSARWTTMAETPWQYGWAPIVDTQNLPEPNAYFGRPDLTTDVLETQSALNSVMSQAARVQRIHGHPKVVATGVGDGSFYDATLASGAAIPPTSSNMTSWGTAFADLTLDGCEDMVIGYGRLGDVSDECVRPQNNY